MKKGVVVSSKTDSRMPKTIPHPRVTDPGMFLVSHGTSKFSLCGNYFASAYNKLLVIYRTSTPFEVLRRISCPSEIDRIEFSKNGFIMCILKKQNRVAVYNILDEEWSCFISDEVGGIINASFSPCGFHVICMADFQLHTSVWDLTTKEEVITLPGSKVAPKFTTDGAYMALAVRKDCKDSISIHCASTMKSIIHFQVGTNELEDIAWSPSGDCIAARDNAINFLVVLHSSFDGSLLGKFTPYENDLGARCMAWSPCGGFLAIGAYNGNLYILDSATCRARLTYFHDPDQADSSHQIDENTDSTNREIMNVSGVQPVKPSTVAKLDPTSSCRGVQTIMWSQDGEFIASKIENAPNSIWIWSRKNLKPVDVFHFGSKIASYQWSNFGAILSICCGDNFSYLWRHETAKRLGKSIPILDIDPQQVLGVRWHPENPKMMACIGKTVGYFSTIEEDREVAVESHI